MYEQYIPAPAPSKTEFNLFNSEMTKVIIGNTSTDNVATGEYVSLKKSIISGLSDGIYKSKSNIASGTPFVSSNLEAVTGGAVNALNDGLDVLNSNLADAVYNADCNNMTNANICYYADGNTANKPTGVSSWLLIRVIGKAGEYITQIASEENVLDGRIWYRTKTSSVWGSWNELALNSKMSSHLVYFVYGTIPVDTPSGLYNLGSFSDLGMPNGAEILSIQPCNIAGSVCKFIGFSVNNGNVYIGLDEAIAVNDATIKIVYAY